MVWTFSERFKESFVLLFVCFYRAQSQFPKETKDNGMFRVLARRSFGYNFFFLSYHYRLTSSLRPLASLLFSLEKTVDLCFDCNLFTFHLCDWIKGADSDFTLLGWQNSFQANLITVFTCSSSCFYKFIRFMKNICCSFSATEMHSQLPFSSPFSCFF